jgi:hypothetical protein
MATTIQSPDFKPEDRIRVDLDVEVRRGTGELGGALGWTYAIEGLGLCGPMGKLEGIVVGENGNPTEIDLTTLPATPDAELGTGPTKLGLLNVLILKSRAENSNQGVLVYQGGSAPWTSGPFGSGSPAGRLNPTGSFVFIGGLGELPIAGWAFSTAGSTFLLESGDATNPIVDLYYATQPFSLP